MDTASVGRGSGRRGVGIRLWLGAAFAGVTLITASSVYVFVNDSSGRTLATQAGDLAVGRTSSLADELSGTGTGEASKILMDARGDNFEVFALDPQRHPIAPSDLPVAAADIEGSREAIAVGLSGRRYRQTLSGDRTVAGAPIFGPKGVQGVVVSLSEPPRSSPAPSTTFAATGFARWGSRSRSASSSGSSSPR